MDTYIKPKEQASLEKAEAKISILKMQLKTHQEIRRTILARIRMRRLLAQEKSND